jgi:hypothetical protein
VSASILTTAGLPELITSSLADYYGLALRLAGDRDELVCLKTRVGALRTKSHLFDTGRFTRDLERAMTAIWERHCSGQPPHHSPSIDLADRTTGDRTLTEVGVADTGSAPERWPSG